MVTRLLPRRLAGRAARLLGRLARDRRGLSLVEFALAMPVMSLLILGGSEIARYVLLNQKLDRLATTVSDLVSQSDEISATDITNIFAAAQNLTWPFSIQTRGAIIVSSIGQVSSQTRVLWQQSCPGNGCSWASTGTWTSRIGTANNAATMPTGFTVSSTDNVIAVEVFYSFSPFLWRVMASRTLYHTSYTRPRLSNLTTLN